MLNASSTSSVAWVAVAAGVIQLVGLLFLIVFFTVGEPFGTLNDICIALTGILSVVLAWMLFSAYPAQAPGFSRLALAGVGIGALTVVVGSALVIFRVTGWVLAGFYTELGNAFIGLWPSVFCFSVQPSIPGHAGWSFWDLWLVP